MWRRSLLIVVLACLPLRAAAQGITIPNTFVNGTSADATAVNANFAALANNALNRTGGTMTGTLTTVGVLPTADNVSDLGAVGTRYANAYVATVTATSFVGSGASLTGLVPTALTGAGRIPMAASYFPAVTSKTANYTASASTDDDIDCDASGGGFTVTLPTPIGNTGKTLNVKKTDSSTNTCTVGTVAGTIDGSSTFAIGAQYQNMTFRSNGAVWEIR